MALTKVTNTGIADDAVTTDKIEDGTVVAADIAPGTIANAKLANSSITLNGSSVSLGGSATVKHIDWQALTVADGSTTLNTTAGKGYFLDTNAGVIEVFLPSSPTRGDTVVLADYSGTFATNQIIINTGGQLLDSTAGNDFKVTTNNSIVELVYVDAAKGWLVKLNQAAGTTPSSALELGFMYDEDTEFIVATGGTITTVDTDYKVHTFTGDGCFVVSSGLGPLATVDYLVLAGGGGGGKDYGGGGGAGGYRTNYPSGCAGIPVSITTYPIVVGSGGSGITTPYSDGTQPTAIGKGSDSVFSTITSTGGGGGGSGGGNNVGSPGGSGGGGRGPGKAGGTGNAPPVSPPQGNPGADGTDAAPYYRGQGGGGAGAAASGTDNGAIGANTTIFGSSPIASSYGEPGPNPGRYFGGGGGAGAGLWPPGAAYGGGGIGGGGNGKANPTQPCGPTTWAGLTNMGGGGGGGNNSPSDNGANGGSGIVIIRYKFQ
jgi:hypothetical protein